MEENDLNTAQISGNQRLPPSVIYTYKKGVLTVFLYLHKKSEVLLRFNLLSAHTPPSTHASTVYGSITTYPDNRGSPFPYIS